MQTVNKHQVKLPLTEYLNQEKDKQQDEHNRQQDIAKITASKPANDSYFSCDNTQHRYNPHEHKNRNEYFN